MKPNVNSGSDAYELAGRLLDELLGDQVEVRSASTACQLDNAAKAAAAAGAADSGLVRQILDGNGQELVSRLLRRRGFRKVGMAGHGYDREPVYRKAA